MPSDKTPVIEHLFFKRWDKQAKKLSKPVVTLKQVQAAIRFCNRKDGRDRSTRNPANFMKDMVRGQNASDNWPPSLRKLRYTAIQRTSSSNAFEFVPYKPGQTEPFPDPYKPTPKTRVVQVQSLSMLSESKTLGRQDEPWLTQTAVNLRIVETHLALSSPLKVVDVIHLQMSIKLRRTEIDAMFMARREDPKTGKTETLAITCEAKQARERILESQIVEQVKAAFEETELDQVIPMAIRAVPGRGIYVVEFQIVSRSEAAGYDTPTLVSDAVYELKPPVQGI
jgi:hypothetical protein